MLGWYKGASFYNNFPLWPFQYTKKCFVYEKISHWSTNHTQEECDELKKKFGEHYPDLRFWPTYE